MVSPPPPPRLPWSAHPGSTSLHHRRYRRSWGCRRYLDARLPEAVPLRARLQHRLHHQALPHALAHRRSTGDNCAAREKHRRCRLHDTTSFALYSGSPEFYSSVDISGVAADS